MNGGGITLKVVVIIHLVLPVWASMCLYFLPPAYFYFNAFVLLFGVWAIVNPENTEAVFMFCIMDLGSIIMDVIFLGIFAPEAIQQSQHAGAHGDLFRFCLGMGILNLLLRPVSSFLMYKVYQERGGQYGNLGIPGMPTFGIGGGSGGSPQHGGYENIDQPVPTNHIETASPHSTISGSKAPIP